MDRAGFRRTMQTLERRHPFEDWSREMSAFEVLISTILSQSTTAANERRAMRDLTARFGAIDPATLAGAPVDAIAQAIWHAGLSRLKAPRIKSVARQVSETWGSGLERLLDRPTDRAREDLLGLPGVGPKTADVVLAMAAGRPIFPVDTHIARIARRWRLVRGGGYEAARAALERRTPPEKRQAWHLALIAHGRELCTARNPRCASCPVARDCDWYRARQRPGRSHREKRGPLRAQRQKVKNR